MLTSLFWTNSDPRLSPRVLFILKGNSTRYRCYLPTRSRLLCTYRRCSRTHERKEQYYTRQMYQPGRGDDTVTDQTQNNFTKAMG